MTRKTFHYLFVLILLYNVERISAQDNSPEPCSNGGAIAASVIITFLLTAAIIIGTHWWYKRRKRRQGKHLIFETDPEKGNDEYAFDNPGFKDAGLTPMSKSLEKVNKLETPKTKWNQWSPLSALTSKSEKKKIQDDSAVNDEIVKVVTLRSHDFTGLGFNVNGNMRDGIYIKDILQKGPASACGKLNPGDRITAVTISFEHMVYEDALSILSYASPYEITIEAKSVNMKNTPQATGQYAQPGHPLYKSVSSTDLHKIEKSKKRLFQTDDYPESVGSNYSSLQKSRSNLTTLERKDEQHKSSPLKSPLNTDQLKAQLERKISQDHDENLRIKNERAPATKEAAKKEAESQRSENKIQKLGVKVFPEQSERKSPRAAELSQNDNNINLERHANQSERGIDEPDQIKVPPEVKKREKSANKTASNDALNAIPPETNETFVRQGSVGGSGIKRDKNGIPQEIPSHMLNAAVAARRNRKPDEKLDKEADVKSPKKLKGKAPAPPPETKSVDVQETPTHNSTMDLDKIQPADEIDSKQTFVIDERPLINGTIDDEQQLMASTTGMNSKNYNSDSDGEIDNDSSVNTIELNASDITIHQTEENDEKQQNRKTASTGDLTRIHRGRKTSSGTLERAQSLDITDTGIPPLNKKLKGSNVDFDSKTNSDDSLYGKLLLNKEPRLSLILDGLNTFQRSRLKKSTEWGNLEDAILNLSKDDESYKSLGDSSDHQSPEFDALVNKVNEIKSETSLETRPHAIDLDDVDSRTSVERKLDQSETVNESPIKEVMLETKSKVKNQIWPTFNSDERTADESITTTSSIENNVSDIVNNVSDDADVVSHEDVLALEEQIRIAEMNLRMSMGHILDDRLTTNNAIIDARKEDAGTKSEQIFDLETNDDFSSGIMSQEPSLDEPIKTTIINYQTDNENVAQNGDDNHVHVNEMNGYSPIDNQETVVGPNANLNTDFILAERAACEKRPAYNVPIDDTNVSDDIKVSRHSLDKLNQVSNVSQVTVNDNISHEHSGNTFNVDLSAKKSALPKLATTKIEPLKPKPKNLTRQEKDYNNFEYNNKLVTTPDLIKNVSLAEAIHNLNNEVTVEGPSSLTLEINENVNSTRSVPLGLHCEKMSNGSSKLTNETSEIELSKPQNLSKSVSNLTYITEIQVLTPNKTAKSNPNISEIEIVPTENKAIRNLDSEFEKYVKNLETNIRTFETNIKNFDSTLQEVIKGEKITNNNNTKKPEKIIDPEKELHKIQEIAEEQLKKLPEMRFTTSSYESKPQEKRYSHIEQLRSNFEKNDKSPPKSLKMDIGAAKSRIPIPASSKTPPMSPERRDSRNLDTESQKELLEMMSSPTVTSTFKYQPKTNNKNITVTSIRTNSKIPSGLPTYLNRPPVPPRKTEPVENETIIQVSANGSNENSFKQWVFNPNDSSITNITVHENKDSKS